jgi:hypothetical protein
MRDIRPDLQERTGSLKDEIAALKDDLTAKERLLESTEELLARENEYWSHQEDLFQARRTANGGKPPLITFIRDMLSQGEALTTKEISARAVKQGYDFEGKSPGRAIHFRLVGMLRANQATKEGEYWRKIDSS